MNRAWRIALGTGAAWLLFAATPLSAQTIIYVPRSSSGPSSVLPSAESYASKIHITLKGTAAPLEASASKFPVARPRAGDVTLFHRPEECLTWTRKTDKEFEVVTVTGARRTVPAPEGSLQADVRNQEGKSESRALEWAQIDKIAFSESKRVPVVPDPAVTITVQSGEQVVLPKLLDWTRRHIRWGGEYDLGYSWEWFVPILYRDKCPAWVDLCEVESLTAAPAERSETDDAGDRVHRFSFLLANGRQFVAPLRADARIPCNLPDGWASVPRDKLAKIEFHLDNIRPPKEHGTEFSIDSVKIPRRGGAPYSVATLRDGSRVEFAAAKWIANVYGVYVDKSSAALQTEAEFRPAEASDDQPIELANIASIQWRGARGDEIQLVSGETLRGRFDFKQASTVLFGKLDESVWGYLEVKDLRKVEFFQEKPATRPAAATSSAGKQ